MDSKDFPHRSSPAPAPIRSNVPPSPLPASVLASLGTLPAPGSLAEAAFGSTRGTLERYSSPAERYPPAPPQTVTGYYPAPAPYVSPQEKARQALMRTVRDLQEALHNRGWQELIADLMVELAQKDVRIEQLQRELYELQLLSHTCELCHTAFNRKKEDGTLEIKAIKSTRVCSANIGDPNCYNRQKADSVAERRAEKKRTEQVASNEYEPTGD